MGQADTSSSAVNGSSFRYVVGIDIGSQTCSLCGLKADKSQVIKPTEFANDPTGFALLLTKLERLGVPPDQMLLGLDATSRYGENLYRFLQEQGVDCVCCTHDKRISLPNNVAYERKRTIWMRRPLHGCCSVARLAVAMCQPS